MNINNRQEDLMTVFDRTWQANHNDDVKKARTREKEFMDKMFNVKKPMESSSHGFKPMTKEEEMVNRQNNMNSMNNFNNQNRLNNIKGKFN